jgi:hypothetical protein
MKRSAMKLIIVLLVLTGAWGIYRHLKSVEVWFWHVRHDDAVDVGGFAVPVPANWYGEKLGIADELLIRIDTNDRTPTKRLKSFASMSVRLEKPVSKRDLDRLLSLELDSMKEHTSEPILQRTFNVDGGSISCIGGNKPSSMGIFDTDPVSWSCKSSMGLQMTLIATESDIEQVWGIISGIRKKS